MRTVRRPPGESAIKNAVHLLHAQMRVGGVYLQGEPARSRWFELESVAKVYVRWGKTYVMRRPGRMQNFMVECITVANMEVVERWRGRGLLRGLLAAIWREVPPGGFLRLENVIQPRLCASLVALPGWHRELDCYTGDVGQPLVTECFHKYRVPSPASLPEYIRDLGGSPDWTDVSYAAYLVEQHVHAETVL